MQDTRDKTCAERIENQMRGRKEQFEELFARADSENDDEREQAQDEIYELPLAVSTIKVWRIDLSTGGPGDWLEVHVDSDGDATRVEYHFNDWFDHASMVLDGDDRDTFLNFAAQVTGDFYSAE